MVSIVRRLPDSFHFRIQLCLRLLMFKSRHSFGNNNKIYPLKIKRFEKAYGSVYKPSNRFTIAIRCPILHFSIQKQKCFPIVVTNKTNIFIYTITLMKKRRGRSKRTSLWVLMTSSPMGVNC